MSLFGYQGLKGEHVPAARMPIIEQQILEQPMFYYAPVRHEACLAEVPRYRISLQITRSRAETGNAIPGGSTLVTHSRQIVPAKHR